MVVSCSARFVISRKGPIWGNRRGSESSVEMKVVDANRGGLSMKVKVRKAIERSKRSCRATQAAIKNRRSEAA